MLIRPIEANEIERAQRAYERLGFERAPKRDLLVPGPRLPAFELLLTNPRSPT